MSDVNRELALSSLPVDPCAPKSDGPLAQNLHPKGTKGDFYSKCWYDMYVLVWQLSFLQIINIGLYSSYKCFLCLALIIHRARLNIYITSDSHLNTFIVITTEQTTKKNLSCQMLMFFRCYIIWLLQLDAIFLLSGLS